MHSFLITKSVFMNVPSSTSKSLPDDTSNYFTKSKRWQLLYITNVPGVSAQHSSTYSTAILGSCSHVFCTPSQLTGLIHIITSHKAKAYSDRRLPFSEIGEFSKQFPQFRTVVSIMEISAFLPCQRPPLILIHPFPLVQGDQKSLDLCAQYDVIDDDCLFLNNFNGRIQCKCRRKCPNPVRIIIPVIPISMKFPILPRRPPFL
jgi:hypothetical protein